MRTHASIVFASLLTFTACGDDDAGGDGNAGTATDSGSPDQVGQICEVPSDCYPEVDPEELAGDRVCLDRVAGGYCTHECMVDDDCCAVEGECVSDFPQVCGPFESTGMMMCFLSCEDEDWQGADEADDNAFCQEYASTDFICRSTGGGADNRKVCVPGECGLGSRCAADEDCGDYDCIDEIEGGYCSQRDCTSNDDCPEDSACVAGSDFNYCAPRCDAESDCTFCRDADSAASCVSDVAFVEDGTTGSVCVVG